MSPAATLTVYCALILLASLAGGWIPLLVNLTHKRMELAVSFVAGVMLGVGLLIMLPHAFMAAMENHHAAATAPEHAHAHDLAHELVGPIMLWLLAGFLVMFLIERYFCFHHHDAPGSAGDGNKSGEHPSGGCAHDHGHAHSHAHAPHHHAHSKHHLTWAGAAVGMTLHSLIDGIALAASVQVAAAGGHGAALAGLGAFLVIFLHKPFDSLTLGTLLAVGGHSRAMRHIVNAAFSLLIPAGILLFHLGLSGGSNGAAVLTAALAFSAGTFLCIAMSDLLPELQFHQHDRFKLSLALVLGLAVAWGVARMEASMHTHGDPAATEVHEHDHEHDHQHEH